jgi:hypothetical protein
MRATVSGRTTTWLISGYTLGKNIAYGLIAVKLSKLLLTKIFIACACADAHRTCGIKLVNGEPSNFLLPSIAGKGERGTQKGTAGKRLKSGKLNLNPEMWGPRGKFVPILNGPGKVPERPCPISEWPTADADR